MIRRLRLFCLLAAAALAVPGVALGHVLAGRVGHLLVFLAILWAIFRLPGVLVRGAAPVVPMPARRRPSRKPARATSR